MTLTQLRSIVAIMDVGMNMTLAAIMIHQTQSGMWVGTRW